MPKLLCPWDTGFIEYVAGHVPQGRIWETLVYAVVVLKKKKV